MKKERIPDLVAEIKREIDNLDILIVKIEVVSKEAPESPDKRSIYDESLALKLHNFYTGCERIFQRIADDINGGVPTSFDWHKRLLYTMALEIEGIRPPVISKETAVGLEEFLAFRHVVRNIYGYELDPGRLKRLVEQIEPVYNDFKKDVASFVEFLKSL